MVVEIIHNKIYEIRGHNVMLDYEIAEMFEVLTKVLNQAVKRNIERFPEDFMFQLTKEEWDFQRSQFVTFEKGKGKYPKFLPYAFTEHGVTMLASVLRSEKAVKVSISVVRAFISLKKYISDRKNISKQIASIKDELSERIDEQDLQIIEIYQVLDKLIQEKEEHKSAERNQIGFKTKAIKSTLQKSDKS